MHRAECGNLAIGVHLLKPKGSAVGFIFLILFFILLVIWVVAWAAFHVAGGFIHLLLLFAFISLIIHFLGWGRRSV